MVIPSPLTQPSVNQEQRSQNSDVLLLGRWDELLDPREGWAGVLGNTPAPACC